MPELIPMPTCWGKITVAGRLDCGHFVWIRYPAKRELAVRITDPYCHVCDRFRVPIHWWNVGG